MDNLTSELTFYKTDKPGISISKRLIYDGNAVDTTKWTSDGAGDPYISWISTECLLCNVLIENKDGKGYKKETYHFEKSPKHKKNLANKNI